MKPAHLQEEGTETLGLRTHAGAAQPSFRLEIIHGPDAPMETVVDGAASRVLVGTGSTCNVVLTDRAVSRRHLALSLRDGSLFVEDLGSTNGSFIGSLRIEGAMLSGGEEIVLGSTRIRTERLATSAVATIARAASFGRVIGASVAMRRLYPLAAALAKSHVPTLIEGEAGTGKELLAEVIHEQGPRAAGSFVVLDPSSVSVDALDVTLFGGSSELPGLLEQAHGGTLVIDEPAELPSAVQSKLARFLQKHPVTRTDGSPIDAADARVIAISRSDVEREVHAGRLREDLATILGAARLELPPLRRREGDVTILATAFFKALRVEDRVLPPITMRRFEAYSWPGNVRELESAVVRFATSGDDATNPRNAFRDETREPSLDELCRRIFDADLALTASRDILVADFERRFVRHVLARHGGNVTRAAAASGVARRYFHVLRVKRGV